jgi:hypothetical protein
MCGFNPCASTASSFLKVPVNLFDNYNYTAVAAVVTADYREYFD